MNADTRGGRRKGNPVFGEDSVQSLLDQVCRKVGIEERWRPWSAYLVKKEIKAILDALKSRR